ncbi:Glycosyltransferase [Melia azedarach]|uniref:Glycosyltransferase n=1 Tax=Melia azedarach TaxID=155640 RepID=A0ACC1YGD4_MELAZ|nr:Glycosyltransferase [Melia azedarach]
MDYTKNSIGNFIVIFVLFAGVTYICTRSPLKSNPLLSDQKPHRSGSNSPLKTIKLPGDELELALERAAMPNKTVILVLMNSAYVQQSVEADTTMLDLFLESFWLGEGTRQLLNNLLIVALDQTAYDRCMFKRLNCYRLVTEEVDFASEKVFMSKDYMKMMWRRILLLLDVVKRGYSFIITDADVMWLRNPFVRLNENEAEDLQISVDKFNGNPQSAKNPMNAGFYFTRSNNKTIELFSTWYQMKDNKKFRGKNEQDVIRYLMRDKRYVQQLQLQVRFLDTMYFSGFCQGSKDIWSVTTVHANCCRHIAAKLSDLKLVLRDWKRYKTFKSENAGLGRNKKYRWSAHVACRNSWKT